MTGRTRGGRGGKRGPTDGGTTPGRQTPLPDALGLVLRDVQTPLAALELNLSLLAADLDSAPPEAADTLREAQRAARRIRQYIDHFVASEIFGQMAMRKRRRRVEVSLLLKRLVDEYRPRARGAGISLELDLPPEPVVCVRGDEVLLERVFQNLLESSLQSPAPGRRVRVQARGGSVTEVRFCSDAPSEGGGDRHLLAARDASWDGYAPSPIGLYGCSQAIEAHGGSIVLESSPQWPTCMRVRLPTASL